MIYFYMNNNVAAIEDFNKAIELYPKPNVVAYLNRGGEVFR
jgi:hypothetical protein